MGNESVQGAIRSESMVSLIEYYVGVALSNIVLVDHDQAIVHVGLKSTVDVVLWERERFV